MGEREADPEHAEGRHRHRAGDALDRAAGRGHEEHHREARRRRRGRSGTGRRSRRRRSSPAAAAKATDLQRACRAGHPEQLAPARSQAKTIIAPAKVSPPTTTIVTATTIHGTRPEDPGEGLGAAAAAAAAGASARGAAGAAPRRLGRALAPGDGCGPRARGSPPRGATRSRSERRRRRSKLRSRPRTPRGSPRPPRLHAPSYLAPNRRCRASYSRSASCRCSRSKSGHSASPKTSSE